MSATVYVLTVLAAVVVVLTRIRLSRTQAAGRLDVGRAVLGVHTVAGGLAVVVWLVYLLGADALGEGPASVVGIAALGFWYVTVVAGLLILLRWRRSRGRHAAPARSDSWSSGPWLSVLAHVGLLVGVCVFTWYYANPGS
ncbi:hypothetical protein [Nocardioides nanhaiensis]|uniref:Integral membrane protein n=1 Tax=Nocardioides nanhaiensis TaxID=1476871 RepID=A0ABP8X5Q6_9ACTN